MKVNIRSLAAKAIGLLVICFGVSVYGQGTIHVTFDGPPIIPAGAAASIQQYDEQAMLFAPLGPSFGRVGINPNPARPDNGSAYLQAALTQSLQFSFTNSSLFELVSVDLAEYSTVTPNPITVQFVGYHQDGGTVTVSLTTDGIIDGTGPIADFETFYFGPEWTDLTRVEIPTFGWSLDNLVVTVVPEPSTASLLFLGGLLLFKCRKASLQRY